MNEPALMLADEPTGNLDSKASEEIISLLRLSNKKYNQTVIVITHKPATALRANKVVVMENGKISAVGTHEQLMNKNKFYTTLAEASNNE